MAEMRARAERVPDPRRRGLEKLAEGRHHASDIIEHGPNQRPDLPPRFDRNRGVDDVGPVRTGLGAWGTTRRPTRSVPAESWKSIPGR